MYDKETIITKDNIASYYEFMGSNERSTHRDLIHFSFNVRSPLTIYDLLNLEQHRERIDDNWKYSCFQDGRVKSQSYFGVKDTLKPIEEYVEEIKSSSEYKEYVFKSQIVVMEQYSNDIYNLSENDSYTLNYSNSDYNRTINDLLETLSCIDIVDVNTYELWKTNSVPSMDKEYFYENITFKGSDISLLSKVIKEYISTH
ncbi:MAG: Unknown protein [uncultured Sulfurovum sp.]|uniref:Uncharacterized protein n=1 Tax=uncultured Sulfurovum sp. TaxID=269237 RepID=A0A6S6SSE2_9BACT|nr:MAG: Unknown protein [uncultured Sulfurovum sp.]